MALLRNTRSRGIGKGTIWKQGSLIHWGITLAHTAYGVRIVRSGRTPSLTAAHKIMNKVCFESVLALQAQPQSARLTASRSPNMRRCNQGSIWQEGDEYRWMVTCYTAEGQRLTHCGRSPIQRAATKAIYKVCFDQQTAATKGLEG